MVEPLGGASIHAATASEKPCSLIAEAPGARHGDLGLTDSCVESDKKAELADWASTLGFVLTWPLGPRTRALLSHPGQINTILL